MFEPTFPVKNGDLEIDTTWEAVLIPRHCARAPNAECSFSVFIPHLALAGIEWRSDFGLSYAMFD